ncbi:hypothetical protein [Streptomyces formicae]|uniref:hypothetical protein n=1 Tax=Streptomyces formicae TaxID=1616117 RepID=UPI001F5AABC8|nr:hypothetical protein [Streptomyces formicae]
MRPPGGPSGGQTRTEVRIVAASPGATRRVAEVLRRCFATTVDRAQGNTPAMVTLAHQGIRLMEAEGEERG